MQTPEHVSELALATTLIVLGFEKMMTALSKAEPVLASISYIVAIVAGLITIYCKLKRKQ